MRVTVLGGGVIGLTSALALKQAGHEVSIVAARTGAEITSAAAGAVWFPFHASPPELVNPWALATHRWLTALSVEAPGAGVDLLEFFQYVDDDSRPWYADAVPGLTLVRSGMPGVDGAPRKARVAWHFRAPRVEPALFMPWIERVIGVPIESREVGSLDEIRADVVVNCTGLGARRLTGDRELRAVYGGIVVTEPGEMDMSVSVSDDRLEGQVFYSIPRRAEMVLGGSTEPCEDDRATTIDSALESAILERCRAAGMTPGRVIRSYGGLRPFRSRIRVERDASNPRIVHNYGHGGSGYTLCWGCALDVVSIIGRGA